MGSKEDCWRKNGCWPAGGVAGAPLLRLHNRMPIRPSIIAPRTAPTVPAISATLLLLLPLPLPVSLVAARITEVLSGESPNVGVVYFFPCTLASLASLSIDLERTLATLSNDDCIAATLESDRERSA